MNIEFKNLVELDRLIQLQVREWRNSKQVSDYFILPKIELNEHLNWLKNLEQNPAKQIAFVIYYDQTPVGLTYFRNITEGKDCDWGIFIHSTEFRGKGIGTKALEYSIKYAFTKMNVQTINLEVLENNTNAINLYKKLGFIPVQKESSINFKNINDEKIKVLNMALPKANYCNV